MASDSFHFWFLVISSNLLIQPIPAYPTGAPCAAQNTLHPSSVFHGESRNLITTPPPYRFSVANSDDLDIHNYVPGRVYTIRLISMDGAHFRGFIMQPRVASRDGTLIGNLRAGHFIRDQGQFDDYGIQFQECAPFKDNSITQQNETIKYFLETKWVADKIYGPVQFVLTILQERDEFWEMWQPKSGLLLPDPKYGDYAYGSTTVSIPKGKGNKNEQKIRQILSQKLEQHQTKKSNISQLGFVAQDESENDDSLGTGVTPTDAKRKTTNGTSPSRLATESPSAEETDDSDSDVVESETLKNQTELIQASAKNVTRLPTPKPPIEEHAGESGADEEDEEEEEPDSTASPTTSLNSGIPKLSKSSSIRKQQNAGENEESSTEHEETNDDLRPQFAVTKPPFRIPLSSLSKLENLFNQGQWRNRTNGSHAQAEFPQPPLFKLEQDASSPSPTPPSPSPPAPPTWPAVNRIEFPTLPPFPVAAKGGKTGDLQAPSVANRKTGTIEEEDIEPASLPSKPGDKVQPALHLLKAATIPPEEGDDDTDDDSETAPQTKPSTGPQSVNGSTTVIRQTSAPADTSDETDEETTEEAVTVRSNDGRKTVAALSAPIGTGPLPPAASALTEEEESVDAQPTRTSTLSPASKGKATRLNVTAPTRRAGVVEGTNETVEEQNDDSILKEQDFCSSSPCLNKATCVSIADESRIECKCAEGWTGQFCDVHDYCGKENPCKNGGQCVNGDSGYSCNCTSVFVGKNCDHKCPLNLCKNGGTCKLEENGGFVCACRPGYTGSKCETDIDECASNPCQNGATCEDRVNRFHCQCPEGYMGDKCHRPCQNIYRSCQIWAEEGRCESTRRTTRWFDINCAVICGQCVYNNNTVKTLVPLPPVLEPLHFLIGKWTVNTTHSHRFPVDFLQGDAGYYEEIEFAPTKVPMFGTPSINFTAVARNNKYPDDYLISRGFMTLKPNISPTQVALMSTGNDGITMIEEGVLSNEVTLEMKVNYIAVVPSVAHKTPPLAKRQFTLYSGYLRETVERQMVAGQTEYFTKYFYKGADYKIY